MAYIGGEDGGAIPLLRSAGVTGVAQPASKVAGAPLLKIRENILAGILWMIAASVFFALTSAIAKWTVARYPVGEVMAMRSLSTFAVTALVMLPRTGFSVYRTKKPGAHLARGFFVR